MRANRLDALVSMLAADLILADIGTDHGYVPIRYIQKHNYISRAYACDIAEGPLKSASRNIADAKLESVIFPVLSKGLAAVPDDATGIVIAGMGLENARQILLDCKHRWPQFKQIVIQINKNVDALRKFLSTEGFRFEQEICVLDKGKYYQICSVIYDGISNRYSSCELFLGPILSKQADDEYLMYCHLQVQKIDNIQKKNKSRFTKERKYLEDYLSESGD